MHISLETPESHTIQAYSDRQIQINSKIYTGSLVVSKHEIITEMEISAIQLIDANYVELLLKYKPEVVLIGHCQSGVLPPVDIVSYLSQQRVGMECMSIGAACRTYNVLLGEERAVVMGIIFNTM